MELFILPIFGIMFTKQRLLLKTNKKLFLFIFLDQKSSIYRVRTNFSKLCCEELYDMANKSITGPKIKYHFQLPFLLVHWSYRKKITQAMF